MPLCRSSRNSSAMAVHPPVVLPRLRCPRESNSSPLPPSTVPLYLRLCPLRPQHQCHPCTPQPLPNPGEELGWVLGRVLGWVVEELTGILGRTRGSLLGSVDRARWVRGLIGLWVGRCMGCVVNAGC